MGGVLLATLGAQVASAQPMEAAGGIYTCVDRNGRRLTADRPIPECLDREQRELSPSGMTRRQIGPSLTELEVLAEHAYRRLPAHFRALCEGLVIQVDDDEVTVERLTDHERIAFRLVHLRKVGHFNRARAKRLHTGGHRDLYSERGC